MGVLRIADDEVLAWARVARGVAECTPVYQGLIPAVMDPREAFDATDELEARAREKGCFGAVSRRSGKMSTHGMPQEPMVIGNKGQHEQRYECLRGRSWG